MSLTKCKTCKHDVASSAKVCPRCGVKNPGIGAKEHAIGCVILIVVIAVIMYAFDNKAETKKTSVIDAQTQKQLDGGRQSERDDMQRYCFALLRKETQKAGKYPIKMTEGPNIYWLAEVPGGGNAYTYQARLVYGGVRLAYTCQRKIDAHGWHDIDITLQAY